MPDRMCYERGGSLASHNDVGGQVPPRRANVGVGRLRRTFVKALYHQATTGEFSERLSPPNVREIAVKWAHPILLVTFGQGTQEFGQGTRSGEALASPRCSTLKFP
jgi:hypothetical protein